MNSNSSQHASPSREKAGPQTQGPQGPALQFVPSQPGQAPATTSFNATAAIPPPGQGKIYIFSLSRLMLPILTGHLRSAKYFNSITNPTWLWIPPTFPIPTGYDSPTILAIPTLSRPSRNNTPHYTIDCTSNATTNATYPNPSSRKPWFVLHPSDVRTASRPFPPSICSPPRLGGTRGISTTARRSTY